MNRYCTAVLALFLTAGLMLPGSALADDPEPADDSTNATSLVANAWESDNTTAAPQQDEPTLDVSVNGSLRFNALFRAYGVDSQFENYADRSLGNGGFTFDTFRIGANGSYGSLIFDFEYAFYPESFGGNYIHHGWVGYEFSDARQIQVGVSQVPFGIQPYASSSWFFNYSYYVGLEDDYDAGIKAMYQANGWDIQGAYYMNAEQTSFFGTANASRYSYDAVPTTSADYIDTRGISEQNQFNIKVAYTFDHGDLGSTKIGVSGQRGQLISQGDSDFQTDVTGTGETDWHAAYAAHLQGRYGGLEAKLQFAQQEMNPPVADGEDDRFVIMGAYGSPNEVASEVDVYSSSLAYHIPVNAGPISEIKPYYDFSLVTKEVDTWNDNAMHDIGFLTSAGPLFVYTDLIISKGHPFNQPFDTSFNRVLKNPENEWRTAFNVNIGVYF
ncbi:OprO/OprP family phosphate-selective porin [Salinibacter ruber]|uniref:OprO/OprP family phosphate-selective porin n=1 Tax=Salinibacter ruber TaxID=146919 RepID=UPI002169830D|nr:OprO/OprP family phosphate-selective porin [Salinibacter ruber]MCS4134122.1 hypothetical protein [Salinibacter ruber]